MKIYRAAARVGLLALVLFAAVAEIFRPAPPSSEESMRPSSWMLVLKTVVATALIGAVLQGLFGAIFAMSGIYNIAADQPHFKPVAWFLKTFSSQSVRFRTPDERGPNLRDPTLVKQGFVLFQKNCQPCHGAPGVANDLTGRGINPKPPAAVELNVGWTDAQLFWIVSHGLKMSGMPGFDQRLSERDRWATVAFVRRLMVLSAVDYARLVRAAAAGVDDPNVPWVTREDFGLRQVQSHGGEERGKALFSSYGCSSCHTIPGLSTGAVGPPLSGFAERQYVAGLLVNAPENLAAWIQNPKRIKSMTAMPNLNVSAADAVDISAYLQTQGSPKRLAALKHAAGVE